MLSTSTSTTKTTGRSSSSIGLSVNSMTNWSSSSQAWCSPRVLSSPTRTLVTLALALRHLALVTCRPPAAVVALVLATCSMTGWQCCNSTCKTCWWYPASRSQTLWKSSSTSIRIDLTSTTQVSQFSIDSSLRRAVCSQSAWRTSQQPRATRQSMTTCLSHMTSQPLFQSKSRSTSSWPAADMYRARWRVTTRAPGQTWGTIRRRKKTTCRTLQTDPRTKEPPATRNTRWRSQSTPAALRWFWTCKTTKSERVWRVYNSNRTAASFTRAKKV